MFLIALSTSTASDLERLCYSTGEAGSNVIVRRWWQGSFRETEFVLVRNHLVRETKGTLCQPTDSEWL
jgi:hypothetical protein